MSFFNTKVNVPQIQGQNIGFSYDYDSPVLQDVDLSLSAGSFTAFLGLNGSGKSTLAKHFNGLLSLQKGELLVAGTDVSKEAEIWQLRKKCQMVFQNPDNQFVSSVLWEDIAFGLENYQVPKAQIPELVSEALNTVGLMGFEDRSPHTLSGGEKQRAALAGVLSLSPDILIFDECTSMLDPASRKEILTIMKELKEQKGKTILMITHYVEEAVMADNICLMKDGQIIAFGSPREILTNTKLLLEAGLLPPFPVTVYEDLKSSGVYLASCPLTKEELVEALCQLS
ncbi:energy-coupling factor transporter ATPase [Lachnospiraceae bacterium OttesenSCG-928-D06]|nr:energy-coupling factor transporter ATPase [Lachnospiraceae bacterium OttesenSCG-928-D06]